MVINWIYVIENIYKWEWEVVNIFWLSAGCLLSNHTHGLFLLIMIVDYEEIIGVYTIRLGQCQTVAYFGFCLGGDMILSSSSALKVRGLKLVPRKCVHIIIYSLRRGLISLTPSP